MKKWQQQKNAQKDVAKNWQEMQTMVKSGEKR